MSGQAQAVSLAMLRCADCGRLDTPMRPVCAGCLGTSLVPTAVPGMGSVASFTLVRRAPSAFRERAPYTVVVVDLHAGPRITGRMAPEAPSVRIGATVRAISAEGADTVFTLDPDQP